MSGEIRTQRACRRRSTPTFLFADLVRYTALTEAVGDAAAADQAREFRQFTKPVDAPRELVLRGLERRVAAWRLA